MDRITVGRTDAELERLLPAWRRLASTPASDPEAYRAMLGVAGADRRPYLVVVERDGEPLALAAGRREPHALRCRIGRRVLLAPRLPAISFPPGAIVGTVDATVAAALAGVLRRSLREGEAEVAVVREIGVESPLFAELRRSGPKLCRDPLPERNLRWTVAIPHDYESFLERRSARLRKTVRHAANRLRRELGPALHVRRFGERAELDLLFADLERVAARTYQRALGVGFRDTPESRALIGHAMERGWFRAWVLYVGEAPCAFTYGVRHGGTYFAAETGYDARLRVGAGDYVMNREIEDLCADPEVRLYDFGFGDAEYKQRYADVSTEEATIRLYAPRLRPLAAGALRTALGSIDRGLRAAAGALDLLELVRRWSRERIRTAAGTEPTPR